MSLSSCSQDYLNKKKTTLLNLVASSKTLLMRKDNNLVSIYLKDLHCKFYHTDLPVSGIICRLDFPWVIFYR